METQSSFKFLTFLGSVAAIVSIGTLITGLYCLISFRHLGVNDLRAPPFPLPARIPLG